MNKSVLNEYCQKNGIFFPVYQIIKRSGLPHKPKFTVSCVLTVNNIQQTRNSDPKPSKKEAEEQAAERMLEIVRTSNQPVVVVEEAKEEYYPIKIIVDGDNVHEAVPWIQRERPHWEVHLFVTTDTVVRNDSVTVHRSKSELKDATDINMMLYVQSLLHVNYICNKDEDIILVSRDKIFNTFITELASESVSLVTNIDELAEI